MAIIKINSPIWREPRSVGVAEFRMKDPVLRIQIEYKEKDGNKLYPGTYFISREKAMAYPTQILPQGVKLRIIPIEDLERENESAV